MSPNQQCQSTATTCRITTDKKIHSACNSTGVGSGGEGYAGDLTPSTIYVDGILICISSVENLIPSHANCMQHVVRYWERQSDGSEYKKTLRRPGLSPGPRWLLAIPSQRTPSPLSALQASPLLPPTPKLVPTSLCNSVDV